MHVVVMVPTCTEPHHICAYMHKDISTIIIVVPACTLDHKNVIVIVLTCSESPGMIPIAFVPACTKIS